VVPSGGKANYVISGEGNIDITSNRDGKKVFTLFPSKNKITITEFSIKYDQINLLHFPNLHSIDDLVYRTNPLTIFLSSEQQLILSDVEMTDLTEENFIFHSDTDRQKYKTQFHLDISAVITLGILIGCVGVFGCMAFMNPSDKDNNIFNHLNKDDDRSSDEPSSSLDCDSLLDSSSDGELEDDDGYDSFLENDSDALDDDDTLREHDWELFSSLKSMFSSEPGGIENSNDDFGTHEERSYMTDSGLENDLHFIRELLEGNADTGAKDQDNSLGYRLEVAERESEHAELENNSPDLERNYQETECGNNNRGKNSFQKF
jgi:hypothetical protein